MNRTTKVIHEEFLLPTKTLSTIIYISKHILSIISVLFIYFYVGETKGLSNKQKKSLFIPGGPYGRKLKNGDVIVHHANQDETSDTEPDNIN